ATILLLFRNASGCTRSAPASPWPKASKARSISASVLAFRTRTCNPRICAASLASLTLGSAIGFCGLTRNATVPEEGTNSCNRPNCLAASPPNMEVTPVAFPPGRLNDKPTRYRILTGEEDNRDIGRCLFGDASRGSIHRDDCNLTTYKIANHFWETGVLTVRPTVFDNDVLTFGIARFLKSLQKSIYERLVLLWR